MADYMGNLVVTKGNHFSCILPAKDLISLTHMSRAGYKVAQ